jgi:hypothetical protein
MAARIMPHRSSDSPQPCMVCICVCDPSSPSLRASERGVSAEESCGDEVVRAHCDKTVVATQAEHGSKTGVFTRGSQSAYTRRWTRVMHEPRAGSIARLRHCALRDLGRFAFGKIPSMTVSLAQQRARAMEQRSENELITLHSSEFTRLSAVRSRVAASRESGRSAQPDEPGADRTVGTREFKKRATDGRDLDTQSRDKT